MNYYSEIKDELINNVAILLSNPKRCPNGAPIGLEL